ARDGDGMEARCKGSSVRAGVCAEREPRNDRDRVPGEPRDEHLAGLFPVAGERAAPDHREVFRFQILRPVAAHPEPRWWFGNFPKGYGISIRCELSDFHASILQHMLDIHFIRENADLVKEAARKKRADVDIDRLLAVDEERRSLRQELDN